MFFFFKATLDTETGFPTSNITFNGDYNAFQTANLLEIKRAIIYNYLLSISMSLSSDITLTKGDEIYFCIIISINFFVGSVVASFIPGTDATSISSAVQSMNNNPNALSDMSVTSVTINGKTFSVTKASDSTSSSSTDYTPLIVIIVVGLVVSTIIVLGVYFGIQQYEKQQQLRQPLINETNETDNNNFKLKERSMISKNILSKNNNQVKPLTVNNINQSSSAAVSVTTLDFTTANNSS